MKNNEKRRLDISAKLIEMGDALMKEGTESKDHLVIQSGTFLILIGSVILSEEDTFNLGELASYFSARRMLSSLEKDGSDITRKINKPAESYDELIKKLKRLREDDGEPSA